MDVEGGFDDSLARLAAALRSSKQFPFAAKTGQILASVVPNAASSTTVSGSDIDSLLATLVQRYHTPIPEAYLSERMAGQGGSRRQHGVFYTPWPLAKYLMRSAAEVLDAEFPGTKPTWIDPACGSGSFALAGAEHLRGGKFLAWDRSKAAIELAKAIGAARGETLASIEKRDALITEPDWTKFDGTGPLMIVGNPPYSNFGKREISPWLTKEMKAYRPKHTERKTNLRDAFLLFLRLAESLVLHRGQGVVAMVLSTTFLDAITQSEVRASLRRTFDELRILRLESQEREGDENLFSIRHPTAACLFIRRAGGVEDRQGRVWRAELSGHRDEKLAWLDQNSQSTTTWAESPTTELKEGQGRAGWSVRAVVPDWYTAAPGLNEIFREYISGVQTKNDSLFLARSRGELETKIRERYDEFEASLVQPILVGPFDPWWIYYDPERLGRARYSVMRHMLRDNLGLVFMRQATGVGEYNHFLVTRHLVTDRVFHSRRGAPFLAPLFSSDSSEAKSNTSEDAPEDWLAFAYALLHSHWYRRGAGEGLRQAFPRVPNREGFSAEIQNDLVRLGRQLIELHAPRQGFEAFERGDASATKIAITGRYPQADVMGEEVRILVSRDECLATIPQVVWGFQIGGVEILKRFLLRRRESTLLAWEVAHFMELVRRLEESIELRRQIDQIEWDGNPTTSRINN